MKKSEHKRRLVSELEELHRNLSVEYLKESPEHKISKDWLANTAAVLKNLDESDYQEFIRLRKSIYPSVNSYVRTNAANEIDALVRQKVAEYKRYNFSDLDRNIKFPVFTVPIWVRRNLEKIVVAVIIAALLAWFGLK